MKRFSTLMWAMTAVALVLMLAPTAMAASCCPDEGEGQLSALDYGRSDVHWKMLAEHASVTLTVSSPCGVFNRTYQAGEDPSFDIGELAPDDPNGTYTWQIRIEPVVDPSVKKALMAARLKGDDSVVKELRREGLLPAGPFIQTGQFTVVDDAVVGPGQVEDRGLKAKAVASRVPGDSLGVLDAQTVKHITAETVISGDLTVYNSLCVGFDCATSESYGADTIRMKENNLRIHADDTSTISGFPNTDWRLEFNSQNSGGGSYFRVVDVSHSRNIMTLEANAPSNSLVVDDGGRVGMGTANPVVELHVVDGDTPTLRLQQDTSSGFAAQTWDVAGNETSFFIRDATNGSTLPFRIRPGASSNSLVIDSDDDVGVGVLSPGFPLTVSRSGAATQTLLSLEATNATAQTVRLRFSNAAEEWFNGVTSIGNLTLNASSNAGIEFFVTPTGDLHLTGSVFTGGPTCGSGCDRVFSPDYDLESIEEHAALMRQNSYLPAVGPTVPNKPMNLSEKTGGILNELEKAHLYIEQLNDGLHARDARISALEQRLAHLEGRMSTQEQPAQ